MWPLLTDLLAFKHGLSLLDISFPGRCGRVVLDVVANLTHFLLDARVHRCIRLQLIANLVGLTILN